MARAAAVARAHPPEGRFLRVAGRRVHALVAGRGPDLVLIHGASGHAGDFSFDLLPRLAARWRVIALDRPGLGWSEPIADPTPAAQARHLAAAAAALGARRPVVLGHSFGGAVALAWALERPGELAALALLAPASHPWRGGLGPLYETLARPLPGRALAPLLAALAPPASVARTFAEIFAPQPVPAGYMAHFGPAVTLRPAVMRENARQLAALKPALRAAAPRYAALDLPVEIVQGDADTIVPLAAHAGRLAEALPRARLRVLPGIGHMPHHAAPAEVVAALERLRPG
ncbi:MAG: alpha/beta hydrolase [Alphaproteobacteria bacterium]|nr:MAG: alpha/beta hydrolase [Alphaproteobacteria bacterium]